MVTAPPNVALNCVPYNSVTKSQNVLPSSAETSLSIQRTLEHCDTYPEKITACGI
jgi:hypothetical protein